MSFWMSFWQDEGGAVVSAELAAIGTVAVIGGTAGMNALGHSVNSELRETAYAIRSLDQSYTVAGAVSSRGWKAGSSYTQPAVEKSLAELSDLIGDRPDPAPQPRKPAKKAKKKYKEQEEQDDAAFLAPDESSLATPDPVEAEDDVSKVETTIEPAPDA